MFHVGFLNLCGKFTLTLVIYFTRFTIARKFRKTITVEIKLIVRLCCLQTMIHFKKKFGPTRDGGEILVKLQISVTIMQIERTWKY